MFSYCMIITISFILGILLSHSIGMATTTFIATALVCIFIIRSLAKRQLTISLFLIFVAFCFGMIRFSVANENRLYRELPEKYVTVTGVIDSQSAETGGTYKYRYILRADSVSYLSETCLVDTRMILHTKEKFVFGDKVRAVGFLNQVEDIKNEYEYDLSLYYKSLGVYTSISACEATKTGEKSSLSPSFLAGILHRETESIVDAHFTQNRASLLNAILTGSFGGFSDSYHLLLIRTGMSRVLYTPYIHIFLISFIAGLLFSSKKTRNFAVMLLLVIYAFFNSGSPTILKAAAVLGILIFRKTIFGFADKSDVLSLTVLIMTAIDPMLCFRGGFAMSVISTLLVYFSFKPVHTAVTKFFIKRHIRMPRLVRVISVWIILVLGTLPFSAYYYNGCSIYGTVLTTLLMPAMIIILVLSPFMLASFAVFGQAPVISQVVDGILALLEKVPYLIEKLPFYYVQLKTPSLLAIIIFCLLWWIFLRYLNGCARTRKTYILLTIVCALMLSSVSKYSFNTLSIYFVNVGQGDGAILHTTHGETVLIDGGGAAEYETDYNIGEAVYLPYLVSHGFHKIDVAILSHYHKDHAEGIIAAAENLKINTLIMPDCTPDNPYRLQLEAIAQAKDIDIKYLMESDEIRFKSGLTIKFLAPDREQLLNAAPNDTSLVAEVRYGKFCALFTGDSSDNIISGYPSDIDILKVAHHGSDSSSHQDFVRCVSPEFAVISVGEDNSYGLPDDIVLKRFRDAGSTILRTDKCGDIRFKIKKDGEIKYTTLKGG